MIQFLLCWAPFTEGGGSAAPSSSPSSPSGASAAPSSPSSGSSPAGGTGASTNTPAAKTSSAGAARTVAARSEAAKAAASGSTAPPKQTGKVANAKPFVQPSERPENQPGAGKPPIPPTGTPAVVPGLKGKGLEGKAFDLGKWDGEVASLPEEHRSIAQAVVDRHVGKVKTEFAAKEAELTRAREEFEKTGKASFETKIAELEGDLRIYKALSEGSEDPRIAQLGERAKLAEASAKSWKAQLDGLQAEQRKAQEATDKRWVAQFKETHKAMLADEAKRTQFFGLCEKDGWEEEAAAGLVGQPESMVRRAKEIREELGLTHNNHVTAVKYARMEAGVSNTPRAPRPSAIVTHGADSQKTSARVEGTSNVRDLSKDDARLESARVGFQSVAGGKAPRGKGRFG